MGSADRLPQALILHTQLIDNHCLVADNRRGCLFGVDIFKFLDDTVLCINFGELECGRACIVVCE